MCIAVIALNGVMLDSCNAYDGFQGNLFFIDIQGSDDPDYTGFNSRWYLIYLTPDELALTAPTFASTAISSPVMTLSATLQVTAPGPGNFSWPHGLEVTPFLIEILQMLPETDDPGAIWAQAGYVDGTNVNLVASEAGVTATILVYTQAAAELTVQVPAATLLGSSPSFGNFSVPHGLGVMPSLIEILPTSEGALWLQNPPFDATNINLSASFEGITATISVYAPTTGALNLNMPLTAFRVISIAPGTFRWPHSLPSTPSRIEILMLSGGSMVAQTPAFDETYVYLEASDAGVIAKILVYA